MNSTETSLDFFFSNKQKSEVPTMKFITYEGSRNTQYGRNKHKNIIIYGTLNIFL